MRDDLILEFSVVTGVSCGKALVSPWGRHSTTLIKEFRRRFELRRTRVKKQIDFTESMFCI